MMRDVFERRPSLTPKTVARSVPPPPMRCHFSSAGDGRDGLDFRPLEAGDGAAVLTLIGRDGLGRLVLGHVHAVGPGLHAPDDGQDRPDPEAPGQESDDAHPQAGAVLPGLNAGLAELLAPDVGVPIFDRGELGEDGLPVRVALGLGQQGVQSDAVDLVVQVGLKDPERRWVRGMVWFPRPSPYRLTVRLTGGLRGPSAPKEHYITAQGHGLGVASGSTLRNLRALLSGGKIAFDRGQRSSVVEQRFRKPRVGSSNLPAGSRFVSANLPPAQRVVDFGFGHLSLRRRRGAARCGPPV